MTLRVLEDGRRRVLGSFLGLAPVPPGLLVRLFRYDITPNKADAASLYTSAEANFTGYVGRIIPGWAPIGDFLNEASTQATPVLFSCSSPLLVGNQIYGYFVSPTNDLSKVFWAERFGIAPIPMTVAGNALLVQAQYSEQSLA
jgi:hypothetical protein